jgi:dolichol kinase
VLSRVLNSFGLDPEDLRQLVHLATTLFALLLRWLDLGQAAALAGAAVLLNWIVFPVTGLDRLFGRDGEHHISGVKLYPVGVLLVIVLFRHLPTAAAGWAALGVGDFASNFFGRHLGRRRLPWNPKKTWVGGIAFVLAGVPASVFLIWFTWPGSTDLPLATSRLLVAAVGSVLAGAVVESVALPRVNDNISVPLAASLVAWLTLVVL